MDSDKVYRSLSNTLKAIVIACIITSVSSSDCSPPSGSVKCDCDATDLQCTGDLTAVSEIQDILKNASSVSKIMIKIAGLSFDPDFKIETITVTNLTLGYGLHTLPENLFLELGPSLVSLNLQNNSIEGIDDRLLSPLFSLTELFLDINVLHDLKSSMFGNLHNLKLLSLTRNDFQVINDDVFENLPSLHTLLLSHNNLTSFKNVNIKSSVLRVLNVSDCFIQGELEKETFSDLPSLEELDISFNRLTRIKSNSLSSLKNLKILNASNNIITELQENAFAELSNLTSLDLRNNAITVIKTTSFAKLFSLNYLDLSGNKLSGILCEYTTDFRALEQIYLQNNEIKLFSAGALFYSPHLKEMDVSGNNLECSCDLTDVAHYLIENSTIIREDLDSILCVVPSTLATMSITDFKTSTCVPVEPCKKIMPDDDDDDYGEFENEETSSVTTIFQTTSSSNASQSIDTIASTLTEATTSVTTQTSPYVDAINTVTDVENGTSENILPFTNLSSFTENLTTLNDTSLTGSTTENLTTLNDTTTSIIGSATEVFPSTNISCSTNSVDENVTSTDATNFTYETRADTVGFTSSETDTTSVTQNATVSFKTTVIDKFSYPPVPQTPCSSLELNIDDLSSDSEMSVAKNFSYDGSVFCVKWTVTGDLPPKSRCIIKYPFLSGNKSENIPCPSSSNEIKLWSKTEKIYKFWLIIFDDEKRVIAWTCDKAFEMTTVTSAFNSNDDDDDDDDEEYEDNEGDSTIVSAVNSQKTTEGSFVFLVTDKESTTYENTNIPTEKTAVSTESTIDFKTASTEYADDEISPESETYEYTESMTHFKLETKSNTPVINKPNAPVYPPSDFRITSVAVYFNVSNFAYVQWSVNKEETSNMCYLTLTATTQYFHHNEGIFMCKNNSYQLKYVKQNEIFKICLISHHNVSNSASECRYSLSEAEFDAEASAAKEKPSPADYKSSLIPLICLLILLVLIIIFIIIKNAYRKKHISEQYDVRAEEEKSQRIQMRPSSSHERTSVRYSYISKENPDA